MSGLVDIKRVFLLISYVGFAYIAIIFEQVLSSSSV
jgi:hypothetical protein